MGTKINRGQLISEQQPVNKLVSGALEGDPYSDHRAKVKAADSVLEKKIKKAVSRKQDTAKSGIAADRQHDVKRQELIGALGEGSFGLVFLTKDKECDMHYALKAVDKDNILSANVGAMMSNERSILLLLDSDFIVRLYATYQDKEFVYLLLESVPGGELYDVYEANALFGKLDHAKFYIASVTCALAHMHGLRVIYRDLKLENCILDANGYLKLTDMGIAKIVIGKTYTVCGTADYFAPETLRQSGHNRAADWWACGVLLFIMVAGRAPFDAPEISKIYKNICKGFSKVKFPKSFPSDLTDVIKSLCRKIPEERATMQKGGVENLKEMPFFSGFSWENLVSRTLVAPFLPPQLNFEELSRKTLSRQIDVAHKLQDMEDWDGSVGGEFDVYGREGSG